MTPPDGPRGVCYRAEGEQVNRLQRAHFVAIAGYSIETPRLLLASTSPRHPHGLGNNEDHVGRYIMVQGAAQTAGRWPEELRMYKAPPPEISSEQFYETDPRRGFARGFSIQTISPLPIGWAEHVLADGHWGRALREYMRDYNHWATIGVLNELLPHPDNRVTLADETDPYGQPVARLDYTLLENDKANMAYSAQVITDILHAAEAQDVLTIQRFAHLIGGARMGSSPQTSVVNANQRVWEVPNLFITDGSVCPTQGAANPALTIMALASRLAQRMASGAAMHDNPAAQAGRTHVMTASRG
jgi:choline dehydrogenase-like flavoprotein